MRTMWPEIEVHKNSDLVLQFLGHILLIVHQIGLWRLLWSKQSRPRRFDRKKMVISGSVTFHNLIALLFTVSPSQDYIIPQALPITTADTSNAVVIMPSKARRNPDLVSLN